MPFIPLQATPPETPSTDDPFGAIADFFESGTWSAIVLLLQVFAVALWLALAYWTYQDARRRIEAPSLVAAAVALSFFLPFLGSIIYLIVRPPEYLDEARERELELATLERGLRDLSDRRKRLESDRGLSGAGPPDGVPMAVALKEAGVVTRDDLEEMNIRLTELEFRMRMLDRSPRRATPDRRDDRRDERRPAAEDGRRPAAADDGRPREGRPAATPKRTTATPKRATAPDQRPAAPRPTPAAAPVEASSNGPSDGDTGRAARPRRVARPDPERSYQRRPGPADE